jgi:class 3 adenylate cyclase
MAEGARRKMVTALFCDVAGSTALGEELDPEALHEVMNRYSRELRAVIERHGGTVEKFIGDAVMAVFGIPQVHEDDALRAVRAAVEIRQRLPEVAREVGVELVFRTGVNTGVVLSAGGEHLAIGDAVNVAARLEQAAAPGEILIGLETLRLVRDAVEVEPLEPLALKGKSEPVPAFQLVGVDRQAAGLARHLEAPMVGRRRELSGLRAAWDRVVQESACHLFTLLGSAGVGKSRLVAELLADVGDTATVLRGRCLHYGEGITFWPLIEALTPVGEPAHRVLTRMASGGAAMPEELFFDVRRLLESLALEQPLILYIDDLHWAETMLFDLLDHVVELSRGSPILVLTSARPELLEARPAWGGGKLNAATVLLEPLSADDCAVLLDGLGDGLGPDERARVIASSEGNPLFLEEMVALAREGDTVTIPSTIQTLLAARLDLLAGDQRDVLERGAVEGEVFHRATLQALSDERLDAQLDRSLVRLVRGELIRPHPSTFAGDEAFRFRHLLIRDAAYESLPKGARADLHERFADWLEENARELPGLDEIAGWHLEQAVRYRSELGREAQPGLAGRAADHLHAAGTRARGRGDAAAAINLLERALPLTAQDSPLRAIASADLAESLIDIGDLTRVDELLAAAERDPNAADQAALTRFEWMLRAAPHGAIGAVEAGLPGILERFEYAGDARGLARAHMVASAARWLASQGSAAGEELRFVADYAGRAGDRGMRARALAQYMITLIYGRRSAPELAREVAELEADEDVGPYLAAFIDLGHAELRRLEGDFDGARRFIRDSIDRLRSLGIGAALGGLEQDLGQTELSAGEPAAALEALLRSDAISAELGERAYRSTTQALLAEAHEQLGNLESARAALEFSDELTAEEDLLNYMITHHVRARIALAEGDHDAAERWARSAVEHARRSEMVRMTAEVKLGLADVLIANGRSDEAAAEAREAFELSEALGDRPGAAAAEATLRRVSG